jgi:hypothetical protein
VYAFSLHAAKVVFDDAQWGDVSETAKNFIAQLLVTDAERRLSAEECLQHGACTLPPAPKSRHHT